MREKAAKTFRKPGKLKSGYLEAKSKEIRGGSRHKQSLWAGMRTADQPELLAELDSSVWQN